MNKIMVTPLGSCRITNVLRSDMARRRITLNLERVFGYTHSCSEALQMVKFLQGDFKLDDVLKPVMLSAKRLSEHAFGENIKSDLYFIELSSGNVLEIDGVFVQTNYWKQHFSEFFSDTDRVRMFWRLVKTGTLEERRTFLEGEKSFLAYDATDQDLLSRVTRQAVTPERLESEMLELMDRLPKVVFVTHCNAKNESGVWLKTRSALVDMVEKAAGRINATLYNPTHLMETFSQVKSFTNDGSLTHFTSEFEEKILLDWDEKFIIPLKLKFGIDPAIDDDSEELKESIQRVKTFLKRNGDSWNPEVCNTEIDKFPFSVELHRLRFNYSVLNDAFDVAKKSFTILESVDQVGSDDAFSMMKVAFQANSWPDVLHANEILDEFGDQSIQSMEMAANAAQFLGNLEDAINLWIACFNHSYNDAKAAYNAAYNFSATQKFDMAEIWCRKSLELSPTYFDAICLFVELLAEKGESVELETSLINLAEDSNNRNNKIEAVLKTAIEKGIAVSVVNALVIMRNNENLSSDFSKQIEKLSASWVKKAKLAEENGDRNEAMLYLRAACDLDDNKQAKQLIKPYWVNIRAKLRAAYVAKDFALVGSLSQECEYILPEIQGSFLLIGRAFFQLQDHENTLVWFEKTVAANALDFVAWLFLARSSLALQKYSLAAKAFNKVLETTPKDNDANKKTIETAESGLKRLVMQTVSIGRKKMKEGELEDAWNLIQVALSIDAEDTKAVSTKFSILRLTRKRLVNFEEDSDIDKLVLANQLLAKDPDDTFGLKVMAQELTKEKNYQEALPVWKKYAELIDDPENAYNQIAKCEKTIRRLNASVM